MITEDYVSFETAKLLSIKGFKGEFHKHYWGYEPGKEFLTEGTFNPEYDYPAPTLQTAMKWLREVHEVIIFIDYNVKDRKYSFDVDKIDGYLPDPHIGYIYDKWYDAATSAINYCLENFIKK